MAVRRNAGSGTKVAWGEPWRWSDPEILVVLYLLAVSLLFVAFPSIDLAISGLFHNSTGFPASRAASLIAFRAASDQLVILVVVVILASLLGKLVWPRRPIAIRPRTTVYLLASLAIGPGLVVNALFKRHWGRPRPVQVFDGGLPFMPAWEISHACSGNCSFMAGEGSSAMWLFALILLVPRGLRLVIGVPLGILLVALSLNRIAFGGHFLSDVLLSWGVTLLVALLLRRFLVRGPSGERVDRAIENALTRAGLRLHQMIARKTGARP